MSKLLCINPLVIQCAVSILSMAIVEYDPSCKNYRNVKIYEAISNSIAW